jgi:hypothetical protein
LSMLEALLLESLLGWGRDIVVVGGEGGLFVFFFVCCCDAIAIGYRWAIVIL